MKKEKLKKLKLYFLFLGIFVFWPLFSSLSQETSPLPPEILPEEVALDETVRAQDLEVSEPKILPDSPFYFLKNWGRALRSFFTFNPIEKAKLRLRYASEKLLEVKKLVKKTKDPEFLKKAIRNYEQEIDNIKKIVERIKDKAEENPRVGKFLDKFIKHQILHKKILEKLEEKVPPKVLERIRKTREKHLRRFGEVMEKLEETPNKIGERLSKILREMKGSKFKEVKALQILKELQEKAPKAAQEGIKKARESILKKFKEKEEPVGEEAVSVPPIDSVAPIEPKTCDQLNGYICSEQEICPGRWLIAVDTGRCCSVQCQTVHRGCPAGQIKHKGLCKPKIIELNLAYSNAQNYIHYLGRGDGGIYDKDLFDFRYPPLINKANELVNGKTTTYDKVKAIANYIYNSKIYDNTFSPEVESIASYWEMDRGDCFYAALLTEAMLNVVGIPALYYAVFTIDHAQTLVNIDGIWGVIDTTFHKEDLNDPDDEVYLPSLEEMREIPLFISVEDYFSIYQSENGYYCNLDKSLCLSQPFEIIRIINNPIFPSTSLYFPTAHKFVIERDGRRNYYGCTLTLPYNCTNGCTKEEKAEYLARLGFVHQGGGSTEEVSTYPIFDWYNKRWVWDQNDKFSKIGYVKLELPRTDLQYLYSCYRISPPVAGGANVQTHMVARYQFDLNNENPVIIKWNKLEKTPEATQEEFNDVVTYLKSVTVDLGIDI